MEKYYLTENNQEINLGDEIEISKPIETSYGKGRAVTNVSVTEETLSQLIKDGFVTVVKEPAQNNNKPNPYCRVTPKGIIFYEPEYADEFYKLLLAVIKGLQ